MVWICGSDFKFTLHFYNKSHVFHTFSYLSSRHTDTILLYSDLLDTSCAIDFSVLIENIFDKFVKFFIYFINDAAITDPMVVGTTIYL